MTSAQELDERADPDGNCALEDRRDDAVLFGHGVPRGLATPRGVCDSIEKRAGTNRRLRSGNDPDLWLRQVVREKLPRNSQRQEEQPAGVHCESADNRRRRAQCLHVRGRLADVGRAPGYVDERGNIGMSSGLCDDSPSIAMADEDDWTRVTLESPCHSIDIVPECAQRVRDGDDPQALDMQQRNCFAPARPVSPRAVDNHHRWSLAVIPPRLASINPASALLHVTVARENGALSTSSDRPSDSLQTHRRRSLAPLCNRSTETDLLLVAATLDDNKRRFV